MCLIRPLQANLTGSAIGLYVAYNLERYYRRRREVWAYSCPSSRIWLDYNVIYRLPDFTVLSRLTTSSDPNSPKMRMTFGARCSCPCISPNLHRLRHRTPRSPLMVVPSRNWERFGWVMYGMSAKSCLGSGTATRMMTGLPLAMPKRLQQIVGTRKRHLCPATISGLKSSLPVHET